MFSRSRFVHRDYQIQIPNSLADTVILINDHWHYKRRHLHPDPALTRVNNQDFKYLWSEVIRQRKWYARCLQETRRWAGWKSKSAAQEMMTLCEYLSIYRWKRLKRAKTIMKWTKLYNFPPPYYSTKDTMLVGRW
jgi:hypothetical protein